MASNRTTADALLSLPFDNYQRYALTCRLLSLLRENADKALRVLDVGGHSSPLKQFLPSDEVIIVDTVRPPAIAYRECLPFQHDGYFLAVGQHLPFADEAFDVVAAHDTLEHVPPEARAPFLRELLRVARRYLVLNGPVYSEDTAWSEKRLAEFMKLAFQGENPALQEHLANGLPASEDIQAVFREHELPAVSIPNGNLILWLAMMGLKHYVIAFPHSEWPHEVLDRTYNATLSPVDFAPPCYRQGFIVAKISADLSALRSLEAEFSPVVSQQMPNQNVRALEALLSALEQHAASVRSELTSLQVQIAQRDELIRQRDRLLNEREAEAARLHEDVAEREGEVAALRDEMESIHNSTGYRLLSRYRQSVGQVLPEGSMRKSAYDAFKNSARRIVRGVTKKRKKPEK